MRTIAIAVSAGLLLLGCGGSPQATPIVVVGADGNTVSAPSVAQPQPKSVQVPVTAPATGSTMLLSPPRVEAAASANALRVDLSWQATGGEPSAYLIERSTNGTTFDRVGFVDGYSKAYTDIRALATSTRYWYRVVAWNKSSSAPSAPIQVTTSPFHVFDGTLFLRKPNLAQWGVEPICVAYESEFFVPSRPVPDTPDEARTREVARRAARLGQILVIDIEKWKLDLRSTPPDIVRGNMQKAIQVIDWIRSEAPTVRVGMYAAMPIRELAAIAREDPQLVRKWHEANAFLMPLARAVDYVFPSVYTFSTFSNDRATWERYVLANIEEARQYGKPVYAFVWMNYHTGNPAEVTGPQIDGVFWKRQLETIRAHADGVVIWGGYQEAWDPQAPWWHATLAFVGGTTAAPATAKPSSLPDPPR